MRRKLRELMEQLREHNQEAEVSVIVGNRHEDFSLTFGDSEGTTKANCKTVSFYVDKLNGNDRPNEEERRSCTESQVEHIPIWRLDGQVYARVRMRELKVDDIIKVAFDNTGVPVINKYIVLSAPQRATNTASGHENWVVDIKRVW